MSDSNTGAPDMTTPEGRGQHMANTAVRNPSAIPAKFHREDGTVDVEALAASYAALERRMSGKDEPEPVGRQANEGANPAPSFTDPAPKPDAEPQSFAAALNDPPKAETPKVWETAQAELTRTGRLTEGTRAALRAGGTPDHVITSMEHAHAAQQRETMSKAAGLVGGQENLTKMIEWAKANMPADQRQQLAADMQGPNGEFILRGLYQRARDDGAFGDPGALVDSSAGNGGPMPGTNYRVTPFTDDQEMQACIRDPRYQTDPAYRRSIEKRLILTSGRDPSMLD